MKLLCVSVQKPKKAVSHDEDEDVVSSKSFSRIDASRSGRAKKEVKYYDESEEDDDDGDMFD